MTFLSIDGGVEVEASLLSSGWIMSLKVRRFQGLCFDQMICVHSLLILHQLSLSNFEYLEDSVTQYVKIPP